jgi:hypothetical protein
MKHSGVELPDDPYNVGIMRGSRTRQCRRRLDQLPDFLAMGRFLCLNLHVGHSLPRPFQQPGRIGQFGPMVQLKVDALAVQHDGGELLFHAAGQAVAEAVVPSHHLLLRVRHELEVIGDCVTPFSLSP